MTPLALLLYGLALAVCVVVVGSAAMSVWLAYWFVSTILRGLEAKR